jgi:hypothetical protein
MKLKSYIYRQMLSELFEPLDSEIKSLIAHIKSVDPLYV